MKYLQIILLVGGVWCGVMVSRAMPGQEAGNDMAAGFVAPPASARPMTWWHWMNGNLSKQGITLDLEAMKRVGIAGFQIFQVGTGIVRGPVEYGSPEHFELLRHAAREADRLGLEFGVHNCPGWSSSGGPWIPPDLSMQVLVWTETAVTGGQAVDIALEQPIARQGFYRDAMVLAFPTPAGEGARIDNWRIKANFGARGSGTPAAASKEPAPKAEATGGPIDPNSILDLTPNMDTEGHLRWQAPAGNWTILRLGHTTTGARNAPAPAGGGGLECDKFNRAAFDCHFEHFFTPLLDMTRPLAAKGLLGATIDSYEVGMQNWTAAFPQEFQKRRGYDLRKYTPAMTGRVVGSAEISDRFLWDVRKTQADLMAENYYGRFAELCRLHGMKSYVEPYDPGNFDEMRAGSFADVPMGEFWQGQWDHHSVKLAASVGHVNGRPIIGAESFTSQSRWTESPYSLKGLGDFMYSQGINRFIFHRFAHQPHPDVVPGMTMGPWGAHFDRTNTWFEQGKAWMEYLARSQYMLQQGTFVADLLYFTGEDSPNVTPQRGKLKPVPPRGYDYDTIDANTILTKAKIQDGRIVLPGGTSYRLFVLPGSKAFTLELLRKIRELVDQGMCLVVADAKPQGVPGLTGYPESDAELGKIADELWGDLDGSERTERSLRKGRVFCGAPLPAVLDRLGAKSDFEFTSASGKAVVNYSHRRTADADIYFVANRWHRTEDLICTFNVAGKCPEIWNAETGQASRAAVYEEADGRTRMPVRLDPSGSVFVVFRSRHSGHYLHAVTKGGAAVVSVDAFSAESKDRPRPQSPNEFGPVFGGSGSMKGEAMPIPATEEPAAMDLVAGANGELLFWQNGRYMLDKGSQSIGLDVSGIAQPTEIVGPWRVTFPPKLGAPPEVTLEKLISWTEHPDKGVKYFSGTAAYTNRFNVVSDALTAGKRLYLDLGRVEVLAEVFVNGKNLGVLWKPPFRVDITDAVHSGENNLEIRVTNLWPNRLIGDEQLPAENEYTSKFSAGGYSSVGIAKLPDWYLQGKPKPPGGRIAFTTWKHYSADSPLLESGLLGPVRLRTAVRLVVER